MTEDDGYETIVPELSAVKVEKVDRDAVSEHARNKWKGEDIYTAFARHRQAAYNQALKGIEADIRYLVSLADWAAGQGLCQIDGIEDPEEWCYRKWGGIGPANGDGYSAEALASAILSLGDKSNG